MSRRPAPPTTESEPLRCCEEPAIGLPELDLVRDTVLSGLGRRNLGVARLQLLFGAALAVLACDGRDVAVFAVQGQAGTDTVGTAGAGLGGAAADAAGAQAATVVSSSGSSAESGSGGAVSSGSGGVEGMLPAPCDGDEDCSPGWLCDKLGCLAAAGSCVPWPPICSPDPDPVCGCDGVTYWNDCTRLRSRAQRGDFGQCRMTASACETGGDCGVPYASCSHLLGSGAMCGRGMGACWVLPPRCEPSTDSKAWRECKPPDMDLPGPCVDTCRAIASERSYAERPRGDICK